VRIGDGALGEVSRSLMKREQVKLVSKPRANDARLAHLLSALEAERVDEYPSGQLFLDSLESAIAALLVTSHNAAPSSLTLNKGGLAPASLRRVLEYMSAKIGEQVALGDLADTAGLSSSHFSHQFRASMGTSPFKYMRALRIDRSKALLRNRNLSVLDVAVAVGFDNQRHFATVFRSVVGAPPSEYRRRR